MTLPGDLVVCCMGLAKAAACGTGNWTGCSKPCRVLVPDLPGSGASGLHANLTIESVAGAVATMIAAEAGGKLVTVIGHSMGGYVALALAEQNPDQLSNWGCFLHCLCRYAARVEVKRKGLILSATAPFSGIFLPNLFSAA